MAIKPKGTVHKVHSLRDIIPDTILVKILPKKRHYYRVVGQLEVAICTYIVIVPITLREVSDGGAIWLSSHFEPKAFTVLQVCEQFQRYVE